MANLEQMSVLIEELRRLSDQSKLDWSETAEEKTFVASFPKYTVTVAETLASDSWGNDYEVYNLTVRDLRGKVLDSVRDSDFPASFSFKEADSARAAMRELFDVARRRALNVDAAISDLLGSLQRLT